MSEACEKLRPLGMPRSARITNMELWLVKGGTVKGKGTLKKEKKFSYSILGQINTKMKRI